MTNLSPADKAELTQKADIALTNLTTDGGMLVTEQANQFIEMIIDQPTILSQVRTVTMRNPSMEINRIGFMSRMLRAAVQNPGAAGTWEDNWYPPRRVAVADRATPTLNRITLNSKEVIAEIRIPYEVLEDNIERGGLENTILRLIAERAALDLEELLIQGDTTVVGSDPYLGLMDGVVKRFTANVVDNAGAVIDANTFNRAIKTLPTRYRRNKSAMRFFPHMDVEQDYRMKISSRVGALGDAVLTGEQAVPVFGVPLVGAAMMPTDKMIFTNPKNIIWGIQRNIRLETTRQIQEREVIIVLTARIANNIEDNLAGVKVINIGSAV